MDRAMRGPIVYQSRAKSKSFLVAEEGLSEAVIGISFLARFPFPSIFKERSIFPFLHRVPTRRSKDRRHDDRGIIKYVKVLSPIDDRVRIYRYRERRARINYEPTIGGGDREVRQEARRVALKLIGREARIES